MTLLFSGTVSIASIFK